MPLLRKPERNQKRNALDIIEDPFYDEKGNIRLRVLVHDYNGNPVTVNMSAKSFYHICPEGQRILSTNGISPQARTGIKYIPEKMKQYITTKIQNNRERANQEDRIIGFLNEGIDKD